VSVGVGPHSGEPETEPSAPETLPRLLSAHELARRWSLKEPTVRKWAREGWLPGFRLRGLWLFDERDLVEFLRRNRREGGANG